LTVILVFIVLAAVEEAAMGAIVNNKALGE